MELMKICISVDIPTGNYCSEGAGYNMTHCQFFMPNSDYGCMLRPNMGAYEEQHEDDSVGYKKLKYCQWITRATDIRPEKEKDNEIK